MRIGKRYGGGLAVACVVMVLCSVVLPVSALAADGAGRPSSGATSAVTDDSGGQQGQGAATVPAGSQDSGAATTGSSFVILAGLEKLRQDLGNSSAPKTAPVNVQTAATAPGIDASAQSQTQSQSSQTSESNQQNQTSAITKPLAASPEVGPERVGVDLNQVENLPLQDAIAMALRNNLGIESARQSVRIAQYNLFGYRGVYDVTSSANINFNDSISPFANIFSGAGTNGFIANKTVTYNFSTTQLVQPTGGQWTVSFNNNLLSTSSVAATLSPQFQSSLQAVFVQPLMRNLSIDANRRQIQILKRNLDVSDSQFRQEVIQIINNVQDAYWNLVFAIRNEKIARTTVELTRTQLDNDRKQVEAGTAAPI
ncbi:MAG TPA: TolC family protein, partial [Blastocatellia bacterium]|nr:TolC family protein [Blastocatellia bacterium]